MRCINRIVLDDVVGWYLSCEKTMRRKFVCVCVLFTVSPLPMVSYALPSTSSLGSSANGLLPASFRNTAVETCGVPLGVKSVGEKSKDLMVISLNFLGGAICADSREAALVAAATAGDLDFFCSDARYSASTLRL